MYLPNISREIFLRSWHCFFRISVNINLYTYLFRNLHLLPNRSPPYYSLLLIPRLVLHKIFQQNTSKFAINCVWCMKTHSTYYLLSFCFSFHFVFWSISLDFFVEQKLRKWKDWCTFVHTSHVYLSNVIFDMATTKLIEVKVLWLTELNFAIRNVLFQFNKSFHIAQWRKNSQIQSIFSLSWLSQICTN